MATDIISYKGKTLFCACSLCTYQLESGGKL